MRMVILPLLAALFLLSACQSLDTRYKPTPLGGIGSIPDAYAITPGVFVSRYNANVARLTKLYMRTKISLTPSSRSARLK